MQQNKGEYCHAIHSPPPETVSKTVTLYIHMTCYIDVLFRTTVLTKTHVYAENVSGRAV